MLIKKKRSRKTYLFGVIIGLSALLAGYGLLLRQKPNFEAAFAVSPQDSVTLTLESSQSMQPNYTLFGASGIINRTLVKGATPSRFYSEPLRELPNYPAPVITPTHPKALIVALTYPWASQVSASQAQYITLLLDSTTLPVVSLNAPHHYFFGDKGLYSIEGKVKTATTYPLHFQMLDTDGKTIVSERMQATVAGNSTRKLPMKSLRFDLEQPLPGTRFFGDSAKQMLSSVQLRNAGNDFLLAFMRDAVVSALSQPTNCINLGFQPVVVFLNGEFWGLQYLRERVSKENLQMKYSDLDASQIILGELHKGKALVMSNGFDYEIGRLMEFVRQTDLTQDANYDSLSQLINIPNFIDYVAVETFVSNSDWPHNNVKCVFLDGQLHFLLYDTDFAFAYPKHYQEQVGNYFNWSSSIHNVNALTHNYFDSLDTQLPSEVGQLYQVLIQIPVFRQQFINRYRDLLDSSLSQARVRQVVHALRNQLSPLMPQHIARWGYPISVEDWQQNTEQIINFSTRRRHIVLNQLEELEDRSHSTGITLSNH